MNWRIKCAAFHILDRLPWGQQLYYAAQRRLTASTRQTQARLRDKIQQTLRYWNCLKARTPGGWLAQASHFELGTGWLPSVPMTFYALGVPTQYLVDLNRHLTPEAVAETAEMFRTVASDIGEAFSRLPNVPERGRSLDATLEPLGMRYAAPYDELAGRVAGTIGFVTASHMLNQLDRSALRAVFRKVHDLLKPGGYFLAQHHLRQLFDGLESRTSPFFSLRYSEWVWDNLVNSRMMSYNRLKGPDYSSLLEEAGFEIAAFDIEPGRPEDFALLDRARVNPIFNRYSREELAARHLFLAARKR